MAEKSV